MEMSSSNPKAFSDLKFHLSELESTQARVGWFESAKYEDGTPVAYVASIQELGSPENSIPPRSFMRTTQVEQENNWNALAAQVADRVLAGKMTAYQAMDTIGLKAQSDVAKKIASIDAPPLSPLTLLARAYKAKGGTINGATIGMLARQLKDQPYNVTASLIEGVSTKPLNDSGHMIATLTHVTWSTRT